MRAVSRSSLIPQSRPKHFSREFLATTKKHRVWKPKGIVCLFAFDFHECAGERDARKMDENAKIIERKRKMIRRRFLLFCVRNLRKLYRSEPEKKAINACRLFHNLMSRIN
jgi:hypothetical protein